MGQNMEVWLGGIWWDGGPWWEDYIYGMETPSGGAYTAILPLMLPSI
jgi:endoglucanase